MQENTYELNGGTLTVRRAGQGRPLLHLHSAGGPRVSPVVEALADHHAIHQPVCPGFEGSARHPAVGNVPDYADLLAEYIARECGGDCDVIGESFGGWVALWLAARHPRLVGQLVLEAPAGLCPPGKGGLPADPAERQRKLYAFPDRAPKETRPVEILQANGACFAGFGGLIYDEALAAQLPQITARTLVLMGTKDEIIPAESGQTIKARVPQSHLTYVFGAAHSLEFDASERVAALVLDFLDRGESFLVRPASGKHAGAA